MKSLYIASQQPLELDGIPLIDKGQIVPQLPELIHVTFVLDGVTYEYDVPKVGDAEGKNAYELVWMDGLYYIAIFWTGIKWSINIDTEYISNLVYSNPTDSDYPIFDTWTFESGTELDSLVTTATAIKQGWQFTFSEDGTIDTYNVKKGDVIRALIDNPTTITDWNIESNSFPTGDFTDYYTKTETDTLLETNLNDAKSYADDLVVGLLDDRGNYDASSNLYPSTGGSGTAGAIKKGDLWTISVNGTLGGVAVTVGDVVRALSDAPGQTSTNWVVTENNLGFVPENSANKATTVTGNETSNTKFGTIKAIVDYVGAAVTWIATNGANVLAHLTNTSNPHSVTATQADALKRDGSNANSDIDLGNYALNAKSVKINGTSGNGHLGLKHQSADATASASETVIFAGSDGEPRYKNDGGGVAQFASRAWVTAQGYITNVITALGYTPENVSNKSDSYTASSSTTYASTKAVVDGLATKQNIPIVVSSSITAENNKVYHVIANATFTDPTGVNGTGYTVLLVNGTFSFLSGGGTFSQRGTLVFRQFLSGSWYTITHDERSYNANTFVPQTRTINGLDLTTNRTLTASDVSAVSSNGAITGATKTKITYDSKGLVTSGADATTSDIADSTNKRYVTDAQLTVIGNTSGTNTGDETQASILSKLGWFAYNRTAESTAVTGTTIETIIENIKIVANTFSSGGILRSYNNKFKKVGIAGSFTVRMYISPNNNSLTGATQIAIAGITSPNLFSELLRTFTATTTSLIGFNSSTPIINDTNVSTAARTETSVSWSSDQYFIITVQLTSSSDSVSLIGASLKNF